MNYLVEVFVKGLEEDEFQLLRVCELEIGVLKKRFSFVISEFF
jgi:hypothetical protein